MRIAHLNGEYCSLKLPSLGGRPNFSQASHRRRPSLKRGHTFGPIGFQTRVLALNNWRPEPEIFEQLVWDSCPMASAIRPRFQKVASAKSVSFRGQPAGPSADSGTDPTTQNLFRLEMNERQEGANESTSNSQAIHIYTTSNSHLHHLYQIYSL